MASKKKKPDVMFGKFRIEGGRDERKNDRKQKLKDTIASLTEECERQRIMNSEWESRYNFISSATSYAPVPLSPMSDGESLPSSATQPFARALAARFGPTFEDLLRRYAHLLPGGIDASYGDERYEGGSVTLVKEEEEEEEEEEENNLKQVKQEKGKRKLYQMRGKGKEAKGTKWNGKGKEVENPTATSVVTLGNSNKNKNNSKNKNFGTGEMERVHMARQSEKRQYFEPALAAVALGILGGGRPGLWAQQEHMFLRTLYARYAAAFRRNIWFVLPMHPAGVEENNVNFVLSSKDGQEEGGSCLNFSVNIIMALGARLHGHAEQAEQFYQRARTVAAELFDETDYWTAEALVAMAYYAMAEGNFLQVVYYLSLARQMLIRLGLQKSPIYFKATYGATRWETDPKRRMEHMLEYVHGTPEPYYPMLPDNCAYAQSWIPNFEHFSIVDSVARVFVSVSAALDLHEEALKGQRERSAQGDVIHSDITYALAVSPQAADLYARNNRTSGDFAEIRPIDVTQARSRKQLKQLLKVLDKAERGMKGNQGQQGSGNDSTTDAAVDLMRRSFVIPKVFHVQEMLILYSLRARCYEALGKPAEANKVAHQACELLRCYPSCWKNLQPTNLPMLASVMQVLVAGLPREKDAQALRFIITEVLVGLTERYSVARAMSRLFSQKLMQHCEPDATFPSLVQQQPVVYHSPERNYADHSSIAAQHPVPRRATEGPHQDDTTHRHQRWEASSPAEHPFSSHQPYHGHPISMLSSFSTSYIPTQPQPQPQSEYRQLPPQLSHTHQLQTPQQYVNTRLDTAVPQSLSRQEPQYILPEPAKSNVLLERSTPNEIQSGQYLLAGSVISDGILGLDSLPSFIPDSTFFNNESGIQPEEPSVLEFLNSQALPAWPSSTASSSSALNGEGSADTMQPPTPHYYASATSTSSTSTSSVFYYQPPASSQAFVGRQL